MCIPFSNSYARLPTRFYSRLSPSPVPAPRLIAFNQPLAQLLGIDADAMRQPSGIAVLAGNRVPSGAEPIATAYAGHQFGHFVPQLGDGRAILLGEVIGRDGQRRDIQLKGSGPTPYSRGGDGRAVLGSVLREYLVSEAMAALGIPTTHALAAVTTGEDIWRDTLMPGAVLIRVAASHIRVGTFQYFAARGDTDGLRVLADAAIARHMPDLVNMPDRYAGFLRAAVARQAVLVAGWMRIGFIHGVMNTDNMAVSGETIDYGPCAFLDAYHPAKVFSAIDRDGRYAFANQPRMALWNLTRLAEALLPLLGDDPDQAVPIAEAALETFNPLFEAEWLDAMRRKLGLLTEDDGDGALILTLLARMAEGEADFTLTFRTLADAVTGPDAERPVRALFADSRALDEWFGTWRARMAREPGTIQERQGAMRAASPAVIPRNHLIQAAIDAALGQNYEPFTQLMTALQRPYDADHDDDFTRPPTPDQRVHRTFCGT